MSPDHEITFEEWCDFLRAGGVVTVEEFFALPPEGRSMLATAGRAVWLERVNPGLSTPPSVRDEALIFGAMVKR